ncbi:Transcription-repair coupling factor [hydrothermal vent metagenome]|uniref:Transcription-repair coupling factor n=1 Tax=hydrothermal vent metagenome TaxID=652676 RepID=A0A3B0WL56_9ZZZZ
MLQLQLPEKQNKTNWNRLYGSSLALAIVEASASHKNGPVIVIVEDVSHADILTKEIEFYKNEKQTIFHLPDWETLPYDIFSPHQDIIAERLTTLHALQSIKSGDILISHLNTLAQKLAPRSYIQGNVLSLKINQTLDRENFRRDLEASGYTNVTEVMEHGEFTIRGSIIDLFPAGSTMPYRLDLFDDEIESIRCFDPQSQRSDNKVKSVELLPAREFPTDEAGIKKFRERYRELLSGDPLNSIIYKSVSDGVMPTGIEYYLPVFYGENELDTLFDYLPKSSLYITPQELNEQLKVFEADVQQRYEQRRHDIERPILSPEHLYQSTNEITDALKQASIIYTSKNKSTNEAFNAKVKTPPDLILQTKLEEPAQALNDYISNYINTRKGRILFVTETSGRREVLSELLLGHHIHPKVCNNWQEFIDCDDQICITVSEISQGLVLIESNISLITESQIYGQRAIQKRRRKTRGGDSDAIVQNLTDLTIGAPVVHIDHGVGRYLGLEKLSGDGYDAEFLLLEYAGNDKLYVPVSSLHLISRYTGASAENAPVHKLGSDQWSKARKKAAKQARDVAAELLDIHARRAAVQGRSYPIDENEYASFCNSFPFEETPDQETAIYAVLEDLRSPQPMDRVVCGDVGFGKTEVAMRAAFAVANTGKQVAILVPTTLLAQQHFQNFTDRFADWPIKVACLSRFNTAKKQKEILENLANGKVDIVVGTHKLLQKTVKYCDLGLIIVDEEHRFGVRHKEHVKSLRAEIDILTLTATPIPRTLNMSLAGIRDLSIISTPPMQRLSINTFVSQWSDTLIQEACQRELKRGGQIYVLHNEVKTIEKITHDIQQLVPEARVEFAHGQMPEKQLEQVMLDFYHQRFNILVATTIIESGIDVPTANTIIINKADRLGLAQLHQIRGRVGRSHHRAYAYLLTPPESLMTEDAKKRLAAIESLEDLGVGFTLATHDLEIRGAGELLGENQSGQISEVGFTLYSELLERAVSALKQGKVPDPDMPLHSGIEIDLGIPALIPDDYVYDIHQRLMLYKRISSATNNNELDDIRVELIDRFGLLPEHLKNLFSVTEIKLAANDIGIISIDAIDSGIKIKFVEQPNINPTKLIELIQTQSNLYHFDGKQTFRILKVEEKIEQRGRQIYDVINTLSVQQAA